MKKKKFRCYLLMFCLIMLTGCNIKVLKRGLDDNNKLSKILDIKTLKIKSDDGYGTLKVITPIVENKNNVFYIENGKRIIKVNKEDKEKTIIRTFKNINRGGLCLEKDYLYYVYNEEVYKSDLKGKNTTKILSKENIKKTGINAKVVSVKRYYSKIYLIMDDYEQLYIVQYNEKTKKYKTILKDDMVQICFCGGNLYYIECGEASICEINLKTLKQQKVREIKKNKDYQRDDDPVYKEITECKGKLYYTRWESKADIGRQVMYEYKKNKKDKKIFEFQEGGGDTISDSTKVIVYGTVMYESDHEGMQVYDLKIHKSYFIKKPVYETGDISFLINDIILYEDNKKSNNVYILEGIR